MNSKFKIQNSKFQIGFTLIELLVVIAVIGVLASATISLLNPAIQQKRARDAKRKTELGRIQAALELFRSDNSSYPSSTTTTPMQFPTICNTAFAFSGTTYMTSIPCDPSTSAAFTYAASGASPTAYTLIACLENVSDGQKDATNVAPCTGTTNWSYTVRNP